MEVHRQFDITVPESDAGARLDKFLSGCISDYSRVQLRRAISNGEVLVDGKTAKPSYRLVPEQRLNANYWHQLLNYRLLKISRSK